jgi:hypothetical protein
MMRRYLASVLLFMLAAAPCYAQQKPLEARSLLPLRTDTVPPDSAQLPPASVGRAGVQIVVGTLTGGLGGVGGAFAGGFVENAIKDCDSSGRATISLCGLVGVLVGGAAGYTFGSSLGVWAIGQSEDGVTTSLAGTLMGSIGGTAAVLIAAGQIEGDHPMLRRLAVLGGPVGATIGNIHSRSRRSNGDVSISLINVRNGRLRLGAPTPVTHRIRGARQTFGHGFRLLSVQW